MTSRPENASDDAERRPGTPDHPGDATELEAVLAQALQRLDEAGKDGLVEVLSQHPEHAAALRDALGHVAEFDRITAPDEPGLPERFGEYTIKSQLGAGGMGVVYLADQDSLGREVALKVVRPEFLMFEGARERFRREIDAVARMDHPGIVPILARGASDGIPWYVMPRLRGQSGERVLAALAHRAPETLTGNDLRSLVRAGHDDADTDEARADQTFAGPFWQAVVRLIRGATLAIRHAHARGVLHRDLKPSNLMFTPSGEAVVLDFGLAHARGDDRVTRSGTTAGSPAYMAPEQLRGEPADERTDVYGLAVTLYTLLALRRPFPGVDGEQLRQRLLAGNPDGLRGRKDLPPELLVVLDCALDRDRHLRYPDADAFAADLQAVLDSRPINAQRLPARIRLRRLAQRHGALTAALAATVLVGIVALGLFAWQQSRSNDRLQQEIERADRLAAERQAANAQLQREIERADRRTATSIAAVRRLLTDAAADELRNRGAIVVTTRLFEDALELFEDLTDDPGFAPTVRLLQLHTHFHLAENAGRLGDLDAATAHAELILTRLGDGELQGERALLRGAARAKLVAIRLDRKQFDGIEERIAQAEADLEAVLDEPELRDEALASLSQLAGNRVHPAMQRGDVEAAEAALRRAIELAGAIRPVRSRFATGAVSAAGDRRDPAPTDASGTASPDPEANDPASFCGRLATARLNLVRFLKRQKRFDEATAVNDEHLAALPAEPGGNPATISWPTPDFARALALNERSSILQRQRQDDPAITAGRAAIALLDDLLRRFPEVADIPRLRSGARGNVGLLLARRDEWEPALELVTGAVEDVDWTLRSTPDEPEALRLLAFNLRLLCAFATQTERWQTAEDAALRLAELEIPLAWRILAATSLLRQPQFGSRPKLRDRVLTMLEQACAAGHELLPDEPVFDPIRSDPRFQALLR